MCPLPPQSLPPARADTQVRPYNYLGGLTMAGPKRFRDSRAPVTKESMLVCHGVAWMIQSSRDEKEAIQRICKFLDHWQYEIDPSELGSFSQASAFRSGDTPSP